MKKVKKILPFLLLSALVIPFVGCTSGNVESVDYSVDTNWVKVEKTGAKNVDVFFITPTITLDSFDENIDEGDFGTIDEIRSYANIVYSGMASAYADSANVYMPLYRQATMKLANSCNFDNAAYLNKLLNNVPYQDVTSALDYYFQHYNNNKPFILAGHSQGSAILINILTNYMQEHQEYLTRMIAAYAIGFAPSEEMFQTYTNLEFASGEADTGVVVSWTTEGANAKGKSILLPEHPMVINPITWTTDTSYGSLNESKGCRVDGYADARINPVRKTVVCTTCSDWTESPKAFSTQSLHTWDYYLYYNDLKANVANRINAFLN